MPDLIPHIGSLRFFAARLGIPVECCPLPAFVLGRTLPDRIRLSPLLSCEEELRVLIHELAHWLLHRPPAVQAERPAGALQTTIHEYEAEAVEALVLERLGLRDPHVEAADPLARFDPDPTAGLLAASVHRARGAAERLAAALAQSPGGLESQAAVELQASTGEEVVLEDETHGMRNLLGLTQAF